MLLAIEGVYENGVVRLLEPLPKDLQQARVVITVLPDAPPKNNHLSAQNQCVTDVSHRELTGDSVVDHYQPRTELGRTLIELRRAYIESGGTLMTQDEVLAEIRNRRNENSDD